LGGQLVATLTSTTTTYHHADYLSVRVSTDASGNKIGEQGHFPYGESWYAASTTTKFIFTTYERDGESGNDYAMARFYINRFGRFCSVDPVDGKSADPQSWNHYVYVRDNPVNLTDPSGQFWQFFLAFLEQLIGRLVMGFFQSGIHDMLGIHINFGGIEIPGLSVDMRTPPTFPTGPGTDWHTLLFGRPDPSKAIIVDTWGASSFRDAGPDPGGLDRFKDCQSKSGDWNIQHFLTLEGYRAAQAAAAGAGVSGHEVMGIWDLEMSLRSTGDYVWARRAAGDVGPMQVTDKARDDLDRLGMLPPNSETNLDANFLAGARTYANLLNVYKRPRHLAAGAYKYHTRYESRKSLSRQGVFNKRQPLFINFENCMNEAE
jgi:RHS repeat-associated protein